MKKTLLFVAMVLSVCMLRAQNAIPNGGFETWGGNSFFTQEQPDGWTAALDGTVTIYAGYGIPLHYYFGTKTTDSHTGQYALKLKSQAVGIPGVTESYQFPGLLQLGEADGFSIPLTTVTNLAGLLSNIGNGQLDSLNLTQDDLDALMSLADVMAPGIPFTVTPAYLKMWVKYLPQDGDEMRVVAFTRNGSTPVGYGYYTSTETMNEYTEINIEFSNPLEPCDTLSIVVLSGGMNPSTATELYIDDISVDFNLNSMVSLYDKNALSVYPNPAHDQLNIQINSENVGTYQLMDLTGKVLREGRVEGGRETLDVSRMTPGMYMLKLHQDGLFMTRKVVVR